MRSVQNFIALFALVFGMAGAAYAETKVISIRSAELVQASPLFTSGKQQLDTEFNKRKADVEADARALAKEYEDFKRGADLMSPEARKKAEDKLTAQRSDFEYQQRKLREDFQKRDRELSDKLMSSIQKIVIEVAKEKGADLVIQDPVYATSAVDVTDEVIKRLKAGGAGK